jgi:hypothetical protein
MKLDNFVNKLNLGPEENLDDPRRNSQVNDWYASNGCTGKT